MYNMTVTTWRTATWREAKKDAGIRGADGERWRLTGLKKIGTDGTINITVTRPVDDAGDMITQQKTVHYDDPIEIEVDGGHWRFPALTAASRPEHFISHVFICHLHWAADISGRKKVQELMECHEYLHSPEAPEVGFPHTHSS